MSFKFDLLSQSAPATTVVAKPKKKIKFVKKIPKKDLACATKETKQGRKYTTCYNKSETTQKKKIKFVKKPKPQAPKSELEKFTGLKKEKANELDPLSLFGMLPQELRKKILTPKETNIQVGLNPQQTFNKLKKKTSEAFEKSKKALDEMEKKILIKYPKKKLLVAEAKRLGFGSYINSYKKDKIAYLLAQHEENVPKEYEDFLNLKSETQRASDELIKFNNERKAKREKDIEERAKKLRKSFERLNLL